MSYHRVEPLIGSGEIQRRSPFKRMGLPILLFVGTAAVFALYAHNSAD